MKQPYIPKSLLDVAEVIKKKHGVSKYNEQDEFTDQGLQELLDRIIKLNDQEQKRFATSLTRRDIIKLIYFITNNNRNIDIEKVIYVLKFRFDSYYMERLYHCWQNHYYRTDNSSIFSEKLFNDKQTEEFYQRNGIHILKLREYILGNVVLNKLCTDIIMKYNVQNYINFKDGLLKMGIMNGSKLGNSLSEIYYCYCKRDEYISIETNDLLNIIKKLPKGYERLFLVNFIKVLNNNELAQKFQILKYYMSFIGEIDSDKFNRYFEDNIDGCKELYITWLNIYKLREMIEDSERYEFWVDFAKFCNIKYYAPTDSIIMIFSTFVVIEFAYKGGTAYWFELDYYNKVVEKECITSKNDKEFKSWLNNFSRPIYRKKHQGYWTDEASRNTYQLLRR